MLTTTHSNRSSASLIAADLCDTTSLAIHMLQKLIDRCFSSFEPKSLDLYESEDVFDTLEAVWRLLFDAVQTFKVDTGETAGPEVRGYVETAKRRIRFYEIAELNLEAFERAKSLPKDAREEFEQKRNAACNIPDEQAVVALAELLGKEVHA